MSIMKTLIKFSVYKITALKYCIAKTLMHLYWPNKSKDLLIPLFYKYWYRGVGRESSGYFGPNLRVDPGLLSFYG